MEHIERGLVWRGEDIDPALHGIDIALTMVKLPHEFESYGPWCARTRRKPSRAAYHHVIELHAREAGEQYWTALGHFGAPGDGLHYGWWNTEQVRALMKWLDGVCEEFGFCAPMPGFSCHADAPELI